MFSIIAQLEQFGIVPTVTVFRRGEWLFKAGAIADFAYFIESGNVSVSCEIGEESQIIRFGYAGSLITALDSFLNGLPSIYSIQALKETRVLKIAKGELDRFWNHDARAQQQWLSIVESLILQQMEREVDLLTNDPQMRYQRVMSRSPQLFQEVPHKYIANYLRMTPETLSRLKKY